MRNLPTLPILFERYFAHESWSMWRAILKAAFGGIVTDAEKQAIFGATNRETTPSNLRELWMIVGRRGGKDAVAAFIAMYLACCCDWRAECKTGGIIVGMIVCPDRRQGRVALNYMSEYARMIPEFRDLVSEVLKESIRFRNGIEIEIHTASFRSVRGYTVPFAILDEIAFFRSDDCANPDSEIITAITPAMATIRNPLLIAISTPYARRGELWNTYRKYYGQEHPSILVVQGPTQQFNPSVPEQVIKEAFEKDSIAAASEYGSLATGIQFRADVETYISLEAVQACTVAGRRELPWTTHRQHFGFADPSGGSQDSFTAAVAHREKSGEIVLDAVREKKPPFSPEAATKELAEFFRAYHIGSIQGDHYAGEWPREQFRKNGIEYEISDLSKSEIYVECLPMLNSNRVQLLDEPRLLSQLIALERRSSRSGKDSIDHPPGGHDDLINAAMGACHMAACAMGEIGEVLIAGRPASGSSAASYSGSRCRGGF